MNLLVISSCTGEKYVRDCPYKLGEADFETDVLPIREAGLARWALPAWKMYTGKQHQYMMRGIDLLRRKFGSSACTLKIVSAGYGLIDEMQNIVPYEVTFQREPSDGIRKRAAKLRIPENVRESIRGFELVIFLLGKEYLLSVRPPIEPCPGQRLVFFTSDTHFRFMGASTVVPAGKGQLHYGAGYLAMKGKMFEHFAAGLRGQPEAWQKVLMDSTPETIMNLIDTGAGLK